MLECKEDSCVITVKSYGSGLYFDSVPYYKNKARTYFQFSLNMVKTFRSCGPVGRPVCTGATWRKAQRSSRKALAVFSSFEPKFS